MGATVLLIDHSAERRRQLRSAVERRGMTVSGEAAGSTDLVGMIAALPCAPTTVLVGDVEAPQTIAAMLNRAFPRATILTEHTPKLRLAAGV